LNLLSPKSANLARDDKQITIPAAASEDTEIQQDKDSSTTNDSAILKSKDDHIVKSVEVKSSKKQALFYQEPKTPDNKTYYIISGSFISEENAQKHYDKLVGMGFKPEIIKGNGNFRVSMVKFNDKNRALNELERIRLQKPNESVWLLGI
jgi:cell division protein FtsN